MISSALSYTGAILAGGQSVRMGQPKEGVVMPGGRRMIEPLMATLASVCKPIVVIGACRGFPILPESGLLHLMDTDPGSGPLAAIRTLLKSGIDQRGYIVTACDQPFLTTGLLSLLMTGDSERPHIFEYEKMPNPFPGYYPVSWLSILELAFDRGERSVCDLLQSCDPSRILLPQEWKGYLKNINTPTDLLSS